MTDWPALIARLEARKVNVRAVLRVSRMTVWRWRNRVSIPTGTHAASLIALDAPAKKVEARLSQRHDAIRNGNAADAERIRAELAEHGIEVTDCAHGTIWRRV